MRRQKLKSVRQGKKVDVAASGVRTKNQEQPAQKVEQEQEKEQHDDNKSVLTVSTNDEEATSESLMSPRRENLVDQWSSMKALSQLQASGKLKSPKIEGKKGLKQKEEEENRNKEYLTRRASPRTTRRRSSLLQSPRRRLSTESSPSSPLVPKQFSSASPRFRKKFSPASPRFRKQIPPPFQQPSEESIGTKVSPPKVEEIQTVEREEPNKKQKQSTCATKNDSSNVIQQQSEENHGINVSPPTLEELQTVQIEEPNKKQQLQSKIASKSGSPRGVRQQSVENIGTQDSPLNLEEAQSVEREEPVKKQQQQQSKSASKSGSSPGVQQQSEENIGTQVSPPNVEEIQAVKREEPNKKQQQSRNITKGLSSHGVQHHSGEMIGTEVSPPNVEEMQTSEREEQRRKNQEQQEQSVDATKQAEARYKLKFEEKRRKQLLRQEQSKKAAAQEGQVRESSKGDQQQEQQPSTKPDFTEKKIKDLQTKGGKGQFEKQQVIYQSRIEQENKGSRMKQQEQQQQQPEEEQSKCAAQRSQEAKKLRREQRRKQSSIQSKKAGQFSKEQQRLHVEKLMGMQQKKQKKSREPKTEVVQSWHGEEKCRNREGIKEGRKQQPEEEQSMRATQKTEEVKMFQREQSRKKQTNQSKNEDRKMEEQQTVQEEWSARKQQEEQDRSRDPEGIRPHCDGAAGKSETVFASLRKEETKKPHENKQDALRRSDNRKNRDPDGIKPQAPAEHIVSPRNHHKTLREDERIGTPPLSPLSVQDHQYPSRRRNRQVVKVDDQQKDESLSSMNDENRKGQHEQPRKNQELGRSKSRAPPGLRVETEILLFDKAEDCDPASDAERWQPPPSPKHQLSPYPPPPPPPPPVSAQKSPSKQLMQQRNERQLFKIDVTPQEVCDTECDTPKARGARTRTMTFDNVIGCEIPEQPSDPAFPPPSPKCSLPPPPPPPPPLNLKSPSKQSRNLFIEKDKSDVRQRKEDLHDSGPKYELSKGPQIGDEMTPTVKTYCDDKASLKCPPPPPPPPISLKSPSKQRRKTAVEKELDIEKDSPSNAHQRLSLQTEMISQITMEPPPPPPPTPPPQRNSPRKHQKYSPSPPSHHSSSMVDIKKEVARQDHNAPSHPPPAQFSSQHRSINRLELPQGRGTIDQSPWVLSPKAIASQSKKEKQTPTLAEEYESIYSSFAEEFSRQVEPPPPPPRQPVQAKAEPTETDAPPYAFEQLKGERDELVNTTSTISPERSAAVEASQPEAERHASNHKMCFDDSNAEEKKDDSDSCTEYSQHTELSKRSLESTHKSVDVGETRLTTEKSNAEKVVEVDDGCKKAKARRDSRLKNNISWPERLDKASDSPRSEVSNLSAEEHKSIKQILTSKVEDASQLTESYIKHQVRKQKNQWMVKLQGRVPPISGVSAAKAIVRWSKHTRKGRNPRIPDEQHWKLSYEERTKAHPGYFLVDVFSLYDTAWVKREPHALDPIAWEERDVRQRFLYEKSISFSRNWFGDLLRKRGNDRYREPVCEPLSMLMHNQFSPIAQNGNADWYSIWQLQNEGMKFTHSTCSESHTTDTPCDNTSAAGESTDFSGYEDYESVSDSSSCSSHTDTHVDDDDLSWEGAPECGTLRNVRQKIGERVSRVHPDYTSSLRQSRFRKKWFPRGTFPY